MKTNIVVRIGALGAQFRAKRLIVLRASHARPPQNRDPMEIRFRYPLGSTSPNHCGRPPRALPPPDLAPPFKRSRDRPPRRLSRCRRLAASPRSSPRTGAAGPGPTLGVDTEVWGRAGAGKNGTSEPRASHERAFVGPTSGSRNVGPATDPHLPETAHPPITQPNACGRCHEASQWLVRPTAR